VLFHFFQVAGYFAPFFILNSALASTAIPLGILLPSRAFGQDKAKEDLGDSSNASPKPRLEPSKGASTIYPGHLFI
jgi:hypothetical protein